MEPDAILDLFRPRFDELIGDAQAAFSDFDGILPLDYRLSIERARPKAVSLRVLHRWRERYGTSGNSPIRIATDETGMEYLFIEGDAFSVGLRVKKLSGCGKSFQHVSQRQTRLRGQESFPEFNLRVAHVFFGYRYTDRADDVVPGLTDMSLSSECVVLGGEYRVRWRRVIWTAAEGVEPVRPIQPSLFPPPPPIIRPRRRTEGDEHGTAGASG